MFMLVNQFHSQNDTLTMTIKQIEYCFIDYKSATCSFMVKTDLT